MTNYQNLYKEKYGRLPVLNKFREKWAMQDVIDSVGFHKANDLLNYYFSLEKTGHPLQFFYYNFDKMENKHLCDTINKLIEIYNLKVFSLI